MNISDVQKYYLLIKLEWYGKLSLLTLFQENLFKKKSKAIKDKGKRLRTKIKEHEKKNQSLTDIGIKWPRTKKYFFHDLVRERIKKVQNLKKKFIMAN